METMSDVRVSLIYIAVNFWGGCSLNVVVLQSYLAEDDAGKYI